MFWLLIAPMVAGVLALAGAAFLAVDNYPRIAGKPPLTAADIERAVRVLEQHDPRKLKPSTQQTITVSQQDLELALDYMASRLGRGAVRVVLQDGAARIFASAELPANPLGRYVNVEGRVTEAAGAVRIGGVRVGRVPVPDWLARWLAVEGLERAGATGAYKVATSAVKRVSIADHRLSVTYEWRPDLADELRAGVIGPEDQERLRAYQAALAAAVGVGRPGSSATLAELIAPLVRVAAERSMKGEPVAENRAMILALTCYVNGKSLAALVPAAREWPRPQHRSVTLRGREDFAQHFTVSATIASGAGRSVADAVGLFKEVDDSRTGSGFSFQDLVADRAGTRFGELATSDPGSAKKLQARVGARMRDSDMMPAPDDLPEGITEADFKRRFDGLEAPKYKRLMAEIDRRVATTPLYR